MSRADNRRRAEFPPPYYWRRWVADAAAPVPPREDAPAEAPVPPPVVPVPAETAETCRVLVVEDDPSQALFAESVLNGAGMQAQVAAVPGEVLPAMEAFRPDLVLMDLHMPGMDGVELTGLIRRHPLLGDTPIVFLTGDPDPERQFEALDVGADDFLTKPVRPRHLVSAVQNRIRRARALRAPPAEGDGRHPATGLYTRTRMLRTLSEAIPGRSAGCVFFLEIEGTATLRDRIGYAALDSVLTEAGRGVGAIAGQHPAARLNDNTFLVYASDLDAEAVPVFARSLRDGIGQQRFEAAGDTLRLRALVGYAALSHGFDDAGGALAAAEHALREARTSPTRISAWHRPPPSARAEDATIPALLREAVATGNGFELAYQPIVAVAGGEQAQYQALIRLRDGAGRLHTAAEILPVAEACGLLHDIDRHALTLAIGILRQRQAAGRPLRLFVTQSARSLSRDGYADWLLDVLSRGGIDGPSLVIDVRQEDAVIHALSLQEFCSAMVPAGVQLCLSQYTPGGEVDALLSQLPLGYLRLAARYAGQLDDPGIRDAMRAAIEHAHRLGLQVVGQQVEDPQAAATLWMSGVDFIQGNLVQQAADVLDFDFQHAVL